MPIEEAVADQPITESADQSVNESAAQDSSAEATGSEQTTGAQTGEGEQESTYQLPDEQSKVFPENVLLEFAQNRYSKLAEILNDQNTPAPIRDQVKQILHDKLNGDIYIQKLKAEGEGPEETEEEEGEDAPIVEADPVKLQEHWNEAVTQFVNRVTDPKVAQTFTDNFVKAFDIKDPQQRAMAVTTTLSGAAVNLMRDAVPELLFSPGPDGKTLIDRYLESKYEGLQGMVKTNAYGSAWDSLRQSDPKFANVPAYNTPEWKEAIGKVAEMVPGFEDAVFTGKDGRVLSPYQNFVAKSRVAISLMQNLNGNSEKAVAAATKAVATGQKLARAAASSQANAKLGAGTSRGQLSSTASDPLKEAIAKHRADNGFAGMDTSKVILSGPGQQSR